MGWFKHLVHSVKHAAHSVTHEASHLVHGGVHDVGKAIHKGEHIVSGVAHKAEHLASDPLGTLTGGMSNKIMLAGGALVVYMVLR